jgi:phage repressor protein C with HTH and peptisase S24 domain
MPIREGDTVTVKGSVTRVLDDGYVVVEIEGMKYLTPVMVRGEYIEAVKKKGR